MKRANNFLLTATKESEKVIKEADILYSQNQLDDLYEFLKQYEDVESGQICWRLARYGQCLKSDQRWEMYALVRNSRGFAISIVR